MQDHPDLRTEADRTPGRYKTLATLGDFRNIYRRADGTERQGCRWNDRATADAMREVLDGETFVECRDMRAVAEPARAPGTLSAIIDG